MWKNDGKKDPLMELANDFFFLHKEKIKMPWNLTIKLIIVIYQEPKVSQTSNGIDDDTWTHSERKEATQVGFVRL